MPAPINYPFLRDSVLPSFWANRIQEMLGNAAVNFSLVTTSATAIKVPGGDPVHERVAIGIQGRWRFVNADVPRTVSGGAGPYDIFVVAADNSIAAVPAPFTDNTNYAFDLRVIPAATTPTIVPGTLDVFRKVGQLDWSGSAITALRQTVVGILPAGITNEQVAPAAAIAESKLSLATDAAAGTGSRRTLGSGATQAMPGTMLLHGLAAALPAAGVADRIYRATDTGEVWIDTGAAWVYLRASSGFQEVVTAEATASSSAANLATFGPFVALTVPAGAFVQFMAKVTIAGAAGRLYIDEAVDFPFGVQILDDVPGGPYYTRADNINGGTGVLGGQFHLLDATPGAHIYTLKYSKGTGGSPTFSNRKLWARVLPF